MLHDIVAMEVNDERAESQDLTDLLADLSFVRTTAPGGLESRLLLSVRPGTRIDAAPSGGRVVLQDGALRVAEVGEDVYVTEGASLFHVQAHLGRAKAEIAPSFDEHPLHLRQRFWAQGVLRLLRQQGLYGLHAAGISTAAR